MTDIKLRPDCELAKALEQLAFAYTSYGLGTNESREARVNLLEVIQQEIEEALGVIAPPTARRRLANEIMGMVGQEVRLP